MLDAEAGGVKGTVQGNCILVLSGGGGSDQAAGNREDRCLEFGDSVHCFADS